MGSKMQQQQILRMRFGHGLRCTEIARKLDKSESAVRMTLARTLNFSSRKARTDGL
jgi:DNA-directed RNA polymerase specialized sigma24 family protein